MNLHKTEIMFLRQKISRDCVRMDERKVEAILDGPTPKLVSELRAFLGLANYYQNSFKGTLGRWLP